ncbi:MAG: RHS repeat-associated core domain-containing protein [Bryobacteraceae bacterium]
MAMVTGTFSPVVSDRTGSIRERGGTRLNYYPFGQERPGATSQTGPTAKFGTYGRETGTSGLDYADQRYYQWSWGRFATPDSYQAASSDVSEPLSYNMYSYAGNDPVNMVDPNGASYCGAQYSFEECFGTGGADGSWDSAA